MKVAAILTGALMIAAGVHATIMSNGGYVGHLWPIPVALGIALVVGAMCVGRAWTARRYLLAIVMASSLSAGEGFALISTGERIIAQREAASEPYRNAVKAHETAKAEASRLSGLVPSSTQRLDAANAALTTANSAVAQSAADRFCAANCRALLEKSVTDAQSEVAAARSAFNTERSAAIQLRNAADDALAKASMPATPDGLAVRLGIGGWALDLLSALLAALALNVGGAAMVAYGAHGQPHVASVAKVEVGRAAVFMSDALRPRLDGALTVRELYRAYLEWCHDRGLLPAEPARFGDDVRVVLERVRLPVERLADGEIQVRGIALAEMPLALPAS